jgi:molybdate/tungstate transport system substrate-binding protein
VFSALAIMAIVTLASTLLFFSLFFNQGEKATLKVYCAGSLIFPVERVAEAFEKAKPNVEVQVEGHGSIQVIRHVTELGDEADVIMVADYSLIPALMYNTTIPDKNESFANWYIRFAGNSVVLAYTVSSKYASEINSENWYEVLSRPDVRFGFPNPLIDALGYRTPMVIQLAEDCYGNDSIFDELVVTNFDPRFSCFDMDGQKIIFVPKFFNPVGDKVVLRASSVQLLPLLELGAIDYIFLYLSNAKQHEVMYIELPEEINLGSPEYQEFYQQVQIRFEHKRFGSIGLTREGKTIYYGLTIPNNAPNPELAAEFVEYVLSGEGGQIFDSSYHPIYKPSLTDNLQALPERLRSIVENEPI